MDSKASLVMQRQELLFLWNRLKMHCKLYPYLC